VASETQTGQEWKDATRPPKRFPKSRVNPVERRRLRDEVREIDFPIAIRGYDRAAVDRYVQKVNHLIAELEISSSPESAIRHALEEVSEETSGLLQRAYETADAITARSRAKADDRLQQAEREAKEVRETAASDGTQLREAGAREAKEARERAQAETQELRATATREANELREKTSRETHELRATAQREVAEMRDAAEARVQKLDQNAETIWRERRRLIEDMSAVAREQLEIAKAAAARFPRPGIDHEEPAGREPVAREEGGVGGEPSTSTPEEPERI
jgi:DivIVA domain-containing protein